MPIENRNLEAGTRLVAKYKNEVHRLEVVQTEEGLRYRLADGREFKSPSAAGSAVMGGSACNGWRFWSLESEVAEADERKAAAKRARTEQDAAKIARKREAGPKAPREPKGRKQAARRAPSAPRRKKNGNGFAANEGLDAFRCETCGAEFPTSAEATEHVAGAHPAEEPTA